MSSHPVGLRSGARQEPASLALSKASSGLPYLNSQSLKAAELRSMAHGKLLRSVRNQQGKTRKLSNNRQPSAAPLSPGPGKPTFGAQASAYDLHSCLDSTDLLAFLDKLQDPSSRRLGSDVLRNVTRLRHSQKASTV